MAKGKWVKEHFKKYGVYKGTRMLSAKIGYALFCRPFYTFMALFFQKADKHRILFESKPDFADNARALYEAMLKQGLDEKYQITWLVNDPRKYRQYERPNVHFLKRQGKWSERYTLAANIASWRAGTIFFTHSLYQLSHKTKGQRWINLWHGCGYKAAKGESQKIAFDQLLVPSELFVQTKSIFFQRQKSDFLPVGYPRYDQLLSPGKKAFELAKSLKERYQVNRIVIWMPTYRQCDNSRFSDDTVKGCFRLPLLADQQDLDNLNETCKQEKVLLLLKYHDMQKKEMSRVSASHLCLIDNAWLKEQGVMLYELLGVTDGLVTDYSSVGVDYVLRDKPIAYVLEDFEAYKQSRGFVFDDPLHYMPGNHVYTLMELRRFLTEVGTGEDSQKDKREELLGVLHQRCDNYSNRILMTLGLIE